MIDYGNAPDSGEIEVTLFGPGCGEAIAIHLGGGFWMLVDSCIEPESKEPAALSYLNWIGVTPSSVVCIVASHWHDDHVRGISKLAETYSSADFVLSGVFSQAEASAFLSAYSGNSNSNLGRGAKELHSVIAKKDVVLPAMHKSILIEKDIDGRKVAVKALSPLPEAFAQSLASLAQYIPSKGDAINNAPPSLKPNLEAVVLHLDFGDDAVLLGADLEDHGVFGWSAMVKKPWICERRPATAYKVAHHGSYTGDCESIWTQLLVNEPIACMTPFEKGSIRLPTQEDSTRIKLRAQRAFVSSEGSRKASMDFGKLKRLGDICTTVNRVDSGFGAIRLRKRNDDTEWRVELFGNARQL